MCACVYLIEQDRKVESMLCLRVTLPFALFTVPVYQPVYQDVYHRIYHAVYQPVYQSGLVSTLSCNDLCTIHKITQRS